MAAISAALSGHPLGHVFEQLGHLQSGRGSVAELVFAIQSRVVV